jgi:glyoxylase-like metal-dependent hydrolase (beta-lactamase superfamily II)
VPTFPNARYLFGRIEYEHWKNQKEVELAIPVFEDSVKPVFEAGKADFVETDHRICDEIRLVPSIGHTPGHVSIAIESKGEQALITGDIAHHPCQLERPEWRAMPDHDPAMAESTRRRMFADLCGKHVLVFGTHFAGPSAGWIEANGETWKMRSQGGKA